MTKAPAAFAGQWRHLVAIAGSGKLPEAPPYLTPSSLVVASSFLPSPLGHRPGPALQVCLALGLPSSVPFQLVPNTARPGSSTPSENKPCPGHLPAQYPLLATPL